jgi:uracil phosphoribosyltransferase
MRRMSTAIASPEHPNLIVLDHPLIRAKLTVARRRETSTAGFRRLLKEIAGLMTFEASRHFETESVEIETAMEGTTGVRLARPVTLVPILRAGIGLSDGVLALMPEAGVGLVGLRRDEQTLEPVPYFEKLPLDIADSQVLLIDPMLATGGSAAYAASLLRQAGCRDVRLLCLVVSPEGVRRMAKEHPDVLILTAALDRTLSERGDILPGLGDAGDRIFGTT